MRVKITSIPKRNNNVTRYENGGQQDKNVPIERLLTDATTGVSQKEYEQGKHPEVNAEVEVGEFILYPDGTIAEVEGKSHSKDGEKMNLPEGARIISDNVLVSKEDVKKYKEMGFDISTKQTYADAFRKVRKKSGITELNEKQEDRFKQLEKNDIKVNDENTKKVNEEFISGKIKDIEDEKKQLSPLEKLFGDLTYNWQEKAKKSSNVKKEQNTTPTTYENGGQQEQIVMQIQQALQQGMPPEVILDELVKSGIDAATAQATLESVMQQMEQPQMKNGGKKELPKYTNGNTIVEIDGVKLSAEQKENGDYIIKGTDKEGNPTQIIVGKNDWDTDNFRTSLKQSINDGDIVSNVKNNKPIYKEDKGNSYIGFLKQPEIPYDEKAGYKFDYTKANNLEFVPTNQHKDKTGFYGKVTKDQLEITKARNPWFNWDNFDVNNKEDVKRFQKEYVDKTGRTDVKIDGLFGQQTASLGIGWGKDETPTTSPTVEKVDETKTLDPYKSIGSASGGFGFYDELPYVQTPWMRSLPPFTTPQYQKISPVKVSPEQAIAEAARQGRLASQSTELGAGRAANLSNIQRITSEVSSDAVANAEKQNAMLKLQVDQFNAGQQGREEEGRINAIARYEPDAQNRLMLNHEDWGSYYQQGYENRQNVLKEARQRQIYQSMSPNYVYDPFGNVLHNPNADVPLAEPNFGYAYGLGQFNSNAANDGKVKIDPNDYADYLQWKASLKS